MDRSHDERRREYKYRFAQAVIFGMPVLALQMFGTSLGGPEAARWIAILQALLSGWITYIGAAGMLFEGAVLLASRRRITGDLLAAAVAVFCYLLSLFGLVLPILFTARPGPAPNLFAVTVLTVALWSGWKWFAFARPGFDTP